MTNKVVSFLGSIPFGYQTIVLVWACHIGTVHCGATEDADGIGPPWQRFSRIEVHMSSKFEVKLYAPDKKKAEQAFAAAFARIEHLNEILSDYESSSELSRLSLTSPHVEPVGVSAELWNVLVTSQQISQHSLGAFDVTVGPLTKLWRRARRQRKLPEPKQLRAARASVDFQFLELRVAARSVVLSQPAMRLDLGGIAKGYAADEALQAMRKLGIASALVNAGGDLAIGDPPPGEAGWVIDVAPLTADQKPSRTVVVANCGIATSGDAWQYIEIDGRRYSHIVDPRTGYGLTTRSSVTVMAPSGMLADGWASALSVLGPTAAIPLADKHQTIKALVVTLADGVPQILVSEGFPKSQESPAATVPRTRHQPR